MNSPFLASVHSKILTGPSIQFSAQWHVENYADGRLWSKITGLHSSQCVVCVPSWSTHTSRLPPTWKELCLAVRIDQLTNQFQTIVPEAVLFKLTIVKINHVSESGQYSELWLIKDRSGSFEMLPLWLKGRHTMQAWDSLQLVHVTWNFGLVWHAGMFPRKYLPSFRLRMQKVSLN